MKPRTMVCPLCGEGEVELVVNGAIVSYPVVIDGSGKLALDSRSPEIDDADAEEYYACNECGEVLASHLEELEALYAGKTH